MSIDVAGLSSLQVLDGFFELDTATAMADIYVWLRYSASRQLTWQRNYNTQPRILSAAQVSCGTLLVLGILDVCINHVVFR